MTATEFARVFTKDPLQEVVEVTDGAINATYEVTTVTGNRFILQQMSQIFSPEVMDTLEYVMPHAEAAGVTIPHRIFTTAGASYVSDEDGRWWRALTYVPGVTIHDTLSVESAASAGALVGQFHTALAEQKVSLRTPVPHFHDTPHIMSELQAVADSFRATDKHRSLIPLVNEIVGAYDKLAIDLSALPQRIIHGDLKVSNIRFSEDMQAIALIDMDTVMRHSVVVEMGDAVRSWAGVRGEDDTDQVFDVEIAEAALRSYLNHAPFITAEEQDMLVDGIALLTLELAARFVTDAYREWYFVLSSKYPDLYTQNQVRAENQLKLLQDFNSKRHLLDI